MVVDNINDVNARIGRYTIYVLRLSPFLLFCAHLVQNIKVLFSQINLKSQSRLENNGKIPHFYTILVYVCVNAKMVRNAKMGKNRKLPWSIAFDSSSHFEKIIR